MNLHPEQVAIDSQCQIVFTWSALWQLDFSSSGTVSNGAHASSSSPLFFHTPDMFLDMGHRYNTIGKLVFSPSLSSSSTQPSVGTFFPVTWHDVLAKEGRQGLVIWTLTLFLSMLFLYSIYQFLTTGHKKKKKKTMV
jgi:hypothetical protein